VEVPVDRELLLTHHLVAERAQDVRFNLAQPDQVPCPDTDSSARVVRLAATRRGRKESVSFEYHGTCFETLRSGRGVQREVVEYLLERPANCKPKHAVNGKERWIVVQCLNRPHAQHRIGKRIEVRL